VRHADHSPKAYKGRPPTYWWDFRHHEDGRMTLIVETTDRRCPSGVICEWNLPEPTAERQIDRANMLIADLQAGRTTLKQAMSLCLR